MDSAKEISGNMSDNGEDSAEDPTMKLEVLEAEKRKLKAAITRQLVSGSGCWRQRRR